MHAVLMGNRPNRILNKGQLPYYLPDIAFLDISVEKMHLLMDVNHFGCRGEANYYG
jgi:hypothetical protein